jgi:hypothetical protein
LLTITNLRHWCGRHWILTVLIVIALACLLGLAVNQFGSGGSLHTSSVH